MNRPQFPYLLIQFFWTGSRWELTRLMAERFTRVGRVAAIHHRLPVN